jgi:hypothetical protein
MAIRHWDERQTQNSDNQLNQVYDWKQKKIFCQFSFVNYFLNIISLNIRKKKNNKNNFTNVS